MLPVIPPIRCAPTLPKFPISCISRSSCSATHAARNLSPVLQHRPDPLQQRVLYRRRTCHALCHDINKALSQSHAPQKLIRGPAGFWIGTARIACGMDGRVLDHRRDWDQEKQRTKVLGSIGKRQRLCGFPRTTVASPQHSDRTGGRISPVQHHCHSLFLSCGNGSCVLRRNSEHYFLVQGQ
ncbi:hypothetical protein K458DRAFT_153552 [Lentithecium fluviatile CBS 122367]|uniref:Uncharacterized protein n=1 Tax=Lentithecium fluviatile CBS 122367 TaxID=1168545 RepID=A0A6G1JF29_9PLEO|nr:hypothetical protein K458DRAFT_153552 [Lentithecium fluviatile CBS 122367]